MELLLSHLNYIDVVQGQVVHDADILIRDGRICRLGKNLQTTGQTLDLTGKWAVPGLINLHEHQTYKRLIGPLYGKKRCLFRSDSSGYHHSRCTCCPVFFKMRHHHHL